MTEVTESELDHFLGQRAELSSAEQNDLPDSAFAYIEPGGKKDADDKTTPRKLRHYPVHDKPHAQNALARANAQLKDDGEGKTIAEKALPKIKAAVSKFSTQSNSADLAGESRDEPTPEDFGISYALKDAKTVLAGVKAKQLADPDNQTDPDDKAVMGHIEAAEAALDQAIVAQSKDGHPDKPARSSNPATPKRAFSSLVEQPPPHTITPQVRMDDEGHIAHFVGYPSPTGVAYSVRDWLGEYTETMDPGCYGKTLREQSDVPTLFNHDGVPMASTASGTKRLSEDGKGLREESDFDRRDALTNSVVVQLQRGVLSKMSMSFRAVKENWNDTYDDRHVGEAALYDTSIVTYPANTSAEGGLVDAMRSALGREGRSLWLSGEELSVRSALPLLHDGLPDDADDLLERSLRALVHADEIMCRTVGPHGRARTFLVAQAMLELRAGKTLSAKNQGLLQGAVDALAAADKQHGKLAQLHAKAHDAVSNVLNSNTSASGDGKDDNQGADNGNPIAPNDGAGPRSLPASVAQARKQVQALKRH